MGQAASARNSAQTAADAAALAAAQDARAQLRQGWLDVILDPAQWDRFLSGEAYDPSACLQAEAFAARNSAELIGDRCVRLGSGTEGFRVTVRTIGQEPKEAIASAEAVVEPRCTFEAPDPPSEPTSTPTPPGEEGDDEEEASPIEGLVCSGDPWEIDPENPVLPDATDLFTVRLSE